MTTIQDQIATWAQSRPLWQQAALRKLAQGVSFDQSDIAAIAQDLQIGRQPTVPPIRPSELPGAPATGMPTLLHSIREISNVNALRQEQELTFESTGLTVVYGDNGSGKSGYARIIKSAVGARHAEPVHPNVFADPAAQPPTATIEFVSSGTVTVAAWPTATDPELKAVSFYDEACGDVYMDRDSELTYRPSVLTLLDGLVAICDAVRATLDENLRLNEAARTPLPAVAEGTPSAAFLAALCATTTPGEIDSACAVPDDVTDQLGALIQEEARLQASDPTKERQRLTALSQRAQELSEHVASLATTLSDETIAAAVNARQSATQLRAAATMASSTTFGAEPVPGVGTETWRALWEAARQFSEIEAYSGRAFPVTSDDARCVLCQQGLSFEASTRLERFQGFMQDTTSLQADAAEEALTRTIGTYRSLDATPGRISSHVTTLETVDLALAQAVQSWLESAARRRDALLTHLDGDTRIDTPPIGPSPRQALDAVATKLRMDAASIDATNFEAGFKTTVATKHDIQSRQTVRQHRSAIEAEVRRIAEKAKLERARQATDTTMITRKASELAEQHATALVRSRFANESRRLRLEGIELRKTRGQKGKLLHRPALLGATSQDPIEEILSEGEQTALGLAGYFTEASFDDSKSALVLDDPVTSLDHIRRASVAHRLAQFATDRQVIVFTHDIVFVADLRRAAEEMQVRFTERSVQRQGDGAPGVCTTQHPWKAKDVKQRFQDLEQHLAHIRKSRVDWDDETYEKECADWGGKLSETWERLINLEIVNQVVDPASGEVRPKMFKVLAAITEDDDREFQQSYGQCSAWARRHDKNLHVNYVAPEPDELEDELKLVTAWFDRVKRYK